MTYLSYFGFDSEPFGHAPQGRFFYASPQHTQVMRRLLHCVQSMQGLAVLIGDIGCGKTTLARRLLEALPSETYVAALVVVVHKDVGPLWLAKHIASQLGVVEPAETSSAILGQLVAHLEALRAQGKRAVVLVDEAQMLYSRELMEEFRGMLNLEVTDAKLISFVFFGLPELDQVMRLDPPLAQRVAMRCSLQPLDAQLAADYINHRLTVVSRSPQTLFTPEAIAAVYAYSHGVPRIINTLCDNILLELFLAGERLADVDLVVSVGSNLNLVVQLQGHALATLLPVATPMPSFTPQKPAVLAPNPRPTAQPWDAGLGVGGAKAPYAPTPGAPHVDALGSLTAVGSLLSNSSVPKPFGHRASAGATQAPGPAARNSDEKGPQLVSYGKIDVEKVGRWLCELNAL